MCPGGGGEGGEQQKLSIRKAGGRWEGCCEPVRESEFCFITIVVIVYIMLDIMRIRFGSQRQGRVCGRSGGYIHLGLYRDDWSQGHPALRYLAPRSQWSPLELWPIPTSPSMPLLVSVLLSHWQWRKEYH